MLYYHHRYYLEVTPPTKNLGRLYLSKRVSAQLPCVPHCVVCGQALKNPVWGFGFYWENAQPSLYESTHPYLFLPACFQDKQKLDLIMEKYLWKGPAPIPRPFPYLADEFRAILAEPFGDLGLVILPPYLHA